MEILRDIEMFVQDRGEGCAPLRNVLTLGRGLRKGTNETCRDLIYTPSPGRKKALGFDAARLLVLGVGVLELARAPH
jgi:hypothetical protein